MASAEKRPRRLASGLRILASGFFQQRRSAGVAELVEKIYRPPVHQAAKLGREVFDGVVPERWVLVMRDRRGQDHYINVNESAWHMHQIGEQLTAADLKDSRRR